MAWDVSSKVAEAAGASKLGEMLGDGLKRVEENLEDAMNSSKERGGRDT